MKCLKSGNATIMEKIEKFRAVRIRFESWTQLPEGEIKAPIQKEYEFIFGVEHQVPTLEKDLEGATAGHRFNLKIPARELYGEHDPALIREIPKEGLLKQRIREGKFYRQIKMGCLVSFKVLEIKSDTVIADFNKPTAGISALMEGEVLAVRKVSEDEISTAEENQRRREIGCG